MKKEDGTKKQYHVYILEVNLAFCDGMTIPLISESLTHTTFFIHASALFLFDRGIRFGLSIPKIAIEVALI